MIETKTVEAVGKEFPMAGDPDFEAQAFLISLEAQTLDQAKDAWALASTAYGYELPAQPLEPTGLPTHKDARAMRAFLARAQFPDFWQKVRHVLMPEEWETMWAWAFGPEQRMTENVREILDLVAVMMLPELEEA